VLVEVTRVVVETEVVEISPQAPTKQPESKLLTICVGQEPSTLYPYGRSQQDIAVTHLLHGIYENMFTTLTYDYQPRGVEKLPSLADGDAEIKQITVQEGDQVYDVNDDVVVLREGVTVITADGQKVTFEGEPLTMSQMVVEFTLQPLVWSDGTPVSAGDSEYSFKLAVDPETPVPKYKIERTENYVATGDLTLEWTGVPGYKGGNIRLVNYWRRTSRPLCH
jgi:peptide/nickel transport system substrate-binding protein